MGVDVLCVWCVGLLVWVCGCGIVGVGVCAGVCVGMGVDAFVCFFFFLIFLIFVF